MTKLTWGFVFLICFYCQSQDTNLYIVQRKLKFGYVKIDTLRCPDVVILHSSYCPEDSFNLKCILELYKKYDVSAHYIIDRAGIVYNLVDENNISYHAGKSMLPDGSVKVNTRSIGIELINTKIGNYTELQYLSLVKLTNKISQNYGLKYILGHSDIAPGRKSDPWNFDWNKYRIMLSTGTGNVKER